ncbi:MAG: type VI secretion system Vgr family protein, partial [Pseudomonas sp.]
MQNPAPINVRDWGELLSQPNRFITLQTAMPEVFLPERFKLVEAVNQEMELRLDCLALKPYMDTSDLLGRPLSLQLSVADGSRRQWQGVVTEVESMGFDGGLARYRILAGTWLSLLKHRRNTLIFQDLDALGIVAQVFADYPQANWQTRMIRQTLPKHPRCTQYRESDFQFIRRILAEEGLSFRFEHLAEPNFDEHGRPTSSPLLIIEDRNSGSPQGGELAFTRIDATQDGDGIVRFSEVREQGSTASKVLVWNPTRMRGMTGAASNAWRADAPTMPPLEVFDAAPTGSLDAPEDVERRSDVRHDALIRDAHRYEGEGAVRHLQPGFSYTLSGHPEVDKRQAFVFQNVEHVATNNLGQRVAALRGREDIEAGIYRNSFSAVTGQTAVVPTPLPKPTAPGVESAIVVGVANQALTSTRDHQVRVQFYWQRGENPLELGLRNTHSAGSPEGHAPGDERSGYWVPVAEASAGANFGQHFTPRIGSEVLIGYTNGDVDLPVIIAQVYGGQDTPPFSAGVDSKTNHPGTVSGLQTKTHDGVKASSWLLDDASGQLRHELRNETAQSSLALGYLIAQNGADRGAYRGEGFEQSTQGWGTVRAGEGLLFSASKRENASSTQMDLNEAHAQLNAALSRADNLDSAAQQAEAGSLSATPAQQALYDGLDLKQDAHYPAFLNGQDASQPSGGQRHGGDLVHRPDEPNLILETPTHLLMTTPNSSVAYAGEHLHLTSQKDAHFSAGSTIAGVTGESLHLFTASGGANVITHDGNLSVQAHSQGMEILADQSVTVTATDDCIEVMAKDKIVLHAGNSTITLQGNNIEISCPGTFIAKAGAHAILDG